MAPRVAIACAWLLALTAPVSIAAPAPAAQALPPIRHVFLLLLENQSYDISFARASPAAYLAHTLPARGALLTHYYAIGHASLGNYVALVRGQAPNEATQLDCPTLVDFAPTAAQLDAHGQLPGSGCVYPAMVKTLPDQLEAAGLNWRGSMGDMGKDPRSEAATCGHVPLGKPANTLKARG